MEHMQAADFGFDHDKFARNLRSSKKEAAPGPSKMTSEHLRFLFSKPDDVHLLFWMGRAQFPNVVIDVIKVGRMTALSKLDGGVRGVVAGGPMRCRHSQTPGQQWCRSIASAFSIWNPGNWCWKPFAGCLEESRCCFSSACSTEHHQCTCTTFIKVRVATRGGSSYASSVRVGPARCVGVHTEHGERGWAVVRVPWWSVCGHSPKQYRGHFCCSRNTWSGMRTSVCIWARWGCGTQVGFAKRFARFSSRLLTQQAAVHLCGEGLIAYCKTGHQSVGHIFGTPEFRGGLSQERVGIPRNTFGTDTVGAGRRVCMDFVVSQRCSPCELSVAGGLTWVAAHTRRSPHSPSLLVDWDFGAQSAPGCLLVGRVGLIHWQWSIAGPPLVAAHTAREEFSGVMGFETPSWHAVLHGARLLTPTNGNTRLLPEDCSFRVFAMMPVTTKAFLRSHSGPFSGAALSTLFRVFLCGLPLVCPGPSVPQASSSSPFIGRTCRSLKFSFRPETKLLIVTLRPYPTVGSGCRGLPLFGFMLGTILVSPWYSPLRRCCMPFDAGKSVLAEHFFPRSWSHFVLGGEWQVVWRKVCAVVGQSQGPTRIFHLTHSDRIDMAELLGHSSRMYCRRGGGADGWCVAGSPEQRRSHGAIVRKVGKSEFCLKCSWSSWSFGRSFKLARRSLKFRLPGNWI